MTTNANEDESAESFVRSLVAEQRRNIKRALLDLHRSGCAIRIGRTPQREWFCVICNPAGPIEHDVCVKRADRLDAIANALCAVEAPS